MLTKNLVKYRVRAGKIFPKLITKKDRESALSLASEMMNPFNSSTDLTMFELESLWEADGCQLNNYFQAFKKILFDSLDVSQVQESVEEKRWEWIHEAQSMRQKHYFESVESFKEQFSFEVGEPEESINENLYRDLPEFRTVKLTTLIEPEQLVERFNLSQVQGLLIRASWLKIKCPSISLEERRALIRSVKFHRLIGEFSSDLGSVSKGFELKLTGPLSVLDNSQSYGVKFAHFLPRVLTLKDWEISAEITVDTKKERYLLEVNQGTGLKSDKPLLKSYIPPEFQQLLQSFNELYDHWNIQAGDEAFHLGEGFYCFPDFILSSTSGEKIYMELFHKWHCGQLKNRLEMLEKSGDKRLVLAVCRSIAKKKNIKALIERYQQFDEISILFTDFPSLKAVSAFLRKRGYLC